jgi:hypothetical protein
MIPVLLQQQKEGNMSISKIFAVSTIVLFAFGLVMIDSAVAGEKIDWQGTTLTTETNQIEVGDVEGHVLILTKAKQLYILPDGTKLVGDSVSTMDINPKVKQLSLTGYGWVVDKDGDKMMRKHEGRPAGKDHWKGTWSFTNGTGKYEGLKGGGTWDMYATQQGQPSFLDIKGEMEVPKQ